MMNREKQKYLSAVNNRSKELYVQDIREGVRNEYELEDEVALLRKMLYCVATSNVTAEVVAEFTEYYNAVETIKKGFKEEIGI